MVKCILDEWEYERGIQVSDEDVDELNLIRNEWRGDWNYTIAPEKMCFYSSLVPHIE